MLFRHHRGTLDVLIHNTSSRAWGMDKLLPMVRSTAQVSSWHHLSSFSCTHTQQSCCRNALAEQGCELLSFVLALPGCIT
jgi:hypothetical protein